MSDDDLLEKAKLDVSYLVDYVKEEIHDTANRYDYEPAWVLQEFKNQFSRVHI